MTTPAIIKEIKLQEAVKNYVLNLANKECKGAIDSAKDGFNMCGRYLHGSAQAMLEEVDCVTKIFHGEYLMYYKVCQDKRSYENACVPFGHSFDNPPSLVSPVPATDCPQ